MFIRTVKTKDKIYVRIVESQREGGKIKQRIIANLGNLQLNKNNFVKIIEGLRKFVDEEFAKPSEIEPQNGLLYGSIIAGLHIWEEIGLRKKLKDRFVKTKVNKIGELYAAIMTINRLISPESKLGLTRWLEDIYFPGYEIEKELSFEEQKRIADNFYRTMDYIERWQKEIEQEIYFEVRDLFNLKVDMIFYDITSTYFEGRGPEELACLGKSRDQRPRDKQIVIGLLLCDGLPIAHHVFEGNRIDKTTVKEVISDAMGRFEIKRFIFVGDRGMVSREVIEYLEGNELDYIVALKRRRSKETTMAIEEKNWDEKVGNVWFKEIKDLPEEISPAEWGLAANKERRLFVCFNADRAEEERQKRIEKMAKTKSSLEDLQESVESGHIKSERDIITRATEILLHHNGKRYYNYEIKEGKIIFFEKADSIRYEEKLDGKFIILARLKNYNLSGTDVVKGYKQLWEIEWAFRDLKDMIEIRPIRHFRECRVRAHIQIAFWALLIERILEKKLKEKGMETSARKAIESLGQIKVVQTKVGRNQYDFVTAISNRNKSILDAIGIKGVPRVILKK